MLLLFSSASSEGSEKKVDRLFVPLASEPHSWFLSGRKRWELRRLARQFTEAHVKPGRRVELRRGYSNRESAIWGIIDEVIIAHSLSEFFDKVDWKVVMPESTSLDDAISDAEDILGVCGDADGPFIGFEVQVGVANENPARP